MATNLQYRFGMPRPELFEEEWQTCVQIIEESNASFVVASGSFHLVCLQIR